MRQFRLIITSSIVAVAAGFAGCGKHATEPPPPVVPEAPVLVATEPPARSSLVLYDRAIWAQFDRELDPRSVDSLDVFLKLDGQRIRCAVTYEAGARKIHISTGATLQLQRTYTVEFTTAIKSAEGVPLAKNIFFQFTTNSLRRITYDLPSQGDLAGPLSMLAWGGTQGPASTTMFHVYAGLDSMSVASRTSQALQDNVFTRLLPPVPWPRGSRVYWAVTAENTNTHETMDGPVTWFDVVSASAPETTIFIRAKDHGSRNSTNVTSYCSNPELPSGPGFNAAIHWNLSDIPSNAWITSATVRLAATTTNRFAQSQPTLHMSQAEWRSCEVVYPGPPYPEVNGFLSGSVLVDTIRVDFSDPRLGAFFEASLRGDAYTHGTLLRTNININYSSSTQQDPLRYPTGTVRYIDPARLGSSPRFGVRHARNAKPATRVTAPGVPRLTPR
jgi:hypothetical protein